MKILGFIFNSKPTVSAHVEYSANKFNNSLWSLSHLKRADINNSTLLQVYQVMQRPLLEYCSPVFHSMLTDEQTQRLESLQRRALRIIYGFDLPYGEIVAVSNIESLQSRRERACLEFARKLAGSQRFGNWFPLNERDGMETRRYTKKSMQGIIDYTTRHSIT